MFIFGTKNVNYREVKKDSITKAKKHLKYSSNKNNILEFDALKMNIAISRGILSKDLSNIDLMFEVFSSYFRYQRIINTSSRNLKLNKNEFENLRDFSGKTRIGEIAQGITYLFSQEILNYPIVVDFEGFLKNYSNIKIEGKTPDFILQNHSDFNIALIESKGHYATNTNKSTKGKLNTALLQCNNGEIILKNNKSNYSVNKKYGVCLKLYSQNNEEESELQYVDPSEDISNNEFNMDIIQYHYASLFLLFGNFKIYEKLISKELLSNSDIENRIKIKIFDKEYVKFEINEFLYKWNFWDNINFISENKIINYAVRIEVLEFLMGKTKYFGNIDFIIKNENLLEDNIKYFFDGVIIIQK